MVQEVSGLCDCLFSGPFSARCMMCCCSWLSLCPTKCRGRALALDVARGLLNIHAHSIVHFDVKPHNVLLAADGTAKVADMSISRFVDQGYATGSQVGGTFQYASPEVLLNRKCTSAVDVYSFGVLLWEIVTGQRAERGSIRPVLVPDECPQAIADLLRQCKSTTPKARPTMKEVYRVLGATAEAPDAV